MKVNIGKYKGKFKLEFDVETNLEDMIIILKRICNTVNKEFINIRDSETNVIATCTDLTVREDKK